MSSYEGYLRFGSNEVVNNSRVRGIAESAQPCPMYWLRGDVCETMWDALGDADPYTYLGIATAPWYDPDLEVSNRFYGLFATSITGTYDSTRTVTATEGITPGGTLGATRKTMKVMKVKGVLMGRGRDAIEYGQAWLSAALDPDGCRQTGAECGVEDTEFFADCPPARSEGQTDEAYEAVVDGYRRYLKNSAAVSGPFITDTLTAGDFWGYVVEFVIESERPWVYGFTKPIDLAPTTPVVVEDITYNRVPYPSAELASGTVVVQTNLATNPSGETNATGWSVSYDGTAITAGGSAPAISTDIASVGTHSIKTTWTAPAAGASPGWVGLQFEVALPGAAVAGQRYSINLWGNSSAQAGSPVWGDMEVVAYWRAAGATVRTDPIGVIAGRSGAVSLASITPPVGATSVIVRLKQNLTSWPAGTIVRLYADALAVTYP